MRTFYQAKMLNDFVNIGDRLIKFHIVCWDQPCHEGCPCRLWDVFKAIETVRNDPGQKEPLEILKKFDNLDN